MMNKVFTYKNCDTCRKALKHLDAKCVKYENVPIVEQPPSEPELMRMLSFLKSAGGSLKTLFNTSGQKYRELGIAEKLNSGLSETDAIEMLAADGKLIKRPFLLTKKGGAVGFNSEVWDELL